MSNETELKDWTVRARCMAHEEMPQHDDPAGREEFRAYLLDLYDQEHEYVEQRRRCVDAALDAYYQEWRDFRLTAAKLRAAAADAALDAQHGPVRTHRWDTLRLGGAGEFLRKEATRG